MKAFIRIGSGSHILPEKSGVKRAKIPSQNKFEDILNKKLEDKKVKISQHAKNRMNMRNIHLDDQEIKKLENAIEKADNKGVKESLILMDNLAFVVSIKNRTVITAIDGPNLKENVFTNIDGAIIV